MKEYHFLNLTIHTHIRIEINEVKILINNKNQLDKRQKESIKS